MGGNFRIGTLIECRAQMTHRLAVITKAIMYPAQTIQDERIVGLERQRLLDERQCLGITRGTIGECLAKCIEGVRIFRILLQDTTQVFLGDLNAIELFGYQGARVRSRARRR